MEFAELKKSLKANNICACYCCYGDDENLISRAVAMIKELAAPPQEFNVSDKEFASGRDLVDELMQLPLMGERRVVIARGKVDMAAVGEYLKSPNPQAVLVTTDYIPHDSWNNRAAAPTYPEGATAVDCNRVGINYVAPFVKKQAAGMNATIGDRAVKELYSRCGGYMSRITQESEKLALLRAGGEITEADVIAEVRADTEYVVFELTDCIVKRDTARALKIVDGMAKSNDLVAAFTILYNRFKKMFTVAVDSGGAAALGIKQYAAQKLREEGAAFTKARLKALVDMLADIDYSYKTGAISQYDALCSFVIQASAR
ncbi:MAG: DNA polymerase III subunit delta [Clostridiales bacterium]|nr:DNA polymerase III subunit delta [Clostridiales bacterium]